MSEIPQATRDLLYARAQMRCERCGDTDGPFAAHHRKLRSQGGTHDIRNLALLCDFGGCHDTQVHAHPTRAKGEGWIVCSYADPATVPVLMAGEFYWLTAEGGYAMVGVSA